MTIATYIKNTVARLANDVGALANRVLRLESHLGYLMKMHIHRSDRDSNGVYRRITHTRPNGTLFQVAQLEHDPLIPVINGYYNKRVVSIYNKAGDEIVESWSVEIRYDSDGVVVSEIIL